MTNKRMRLPKEGIIEPEERSSPGLDRGEDVEGHGFPNQAPPPTSRREPHPGGEIVPTDDDVEGRRLA